ncbi:MAG: site-2 protease family protein [Desulfurococcales archaeon]|nr:site-2 protease family protein [Desulfurococcales archaeon]
MEPLQLILIIVAIELSLYGISSMLPQVRRLFEKIGLDPIPLGILLRRRSSVDVLNIFLGSRRARIFFTIGIPAMVISMALFYIFVYVVGIEFVARFLGAVSSGGETPQSPLVPIIPGITITGEDIIYLLIAIGVGVTIHELGHAIAAKAEGMRIKSYGAGLILFIPLAFVELEEEDLLRSIKISAGRILSAGILMNILLFAVSTGAMLGVISYAPLAGVSQGLIVEGVEKGSIAEASGIQPGLLILSINGTPIRGLEDFMLYRQSIVSDKGVYLSIDGIYPNGSRYNVLIYKPPNATRLGIYLSVAPLALGLSMAALVSIGDHGYTRLYWLENLIRVFLWISIINISLAVINAAPLYITDGGKFLDIVSPKRLSWSLQAITSAGFILIFALSLINILS